MLGVTENGLYIGTDRMVRFLSGTDPKQMAVRVISGVGAVSGAVPLSVAAFGGNGQPAGRECAWVDSDGYLCVGKPDGVIIRPHRERFCMGNLGSATLAEIERGGLRQVVVGFDRQEVGVMPVDDAAIAEVFSYGLVLGE
jgi:hypothetical protein